MDLFVKLLVGLLVLQSISVSYSRLLLDNHRYVRSVDKDEAAVVRRTSDEVNDQQIEVHNAAIEADSGESDQTQTEIAYVMNKINLKDSDSSSSSSSSSSSDESGNKSDENVGGCIGEGCDGGGGGGDDGSESSEEGEGGGGCIGEGCNGGGGGGNDGSKSSEESEGGGGCIGEGCNGGGGGGDDGSKSSEEGEGGGGCIGEGCNGGGGGGDDGSKSSEEGEGGGGCIGEGCNGGGGGGDDGSKSSEEGEGGGGCIGEGCNGGGGGGDDGSKSSEEGEGGGGCIGEGCNGGGGGGDDGSKSSEEGEGGGGCIGEGCNGGGGGGDDGSKSSEEGEGGGGCIGEGCNGGGGGGDDGSKSSEQSEGSSEESGEGGGGGGGTGTCPGKGCDWPARNCSIFPKMTKCMESEMDRMFDVTTLYFLVDENTRTPFDHGLNLIESFALIYPSPSSRMLRGVIPVTRSIVRVIFGAFNKFKGILGQTIKYLVNEGVIPPSLVNVVQNAFPGVIFGVDHGNRLITRGLGCKTCLPPKYSSCSIADFSKFWKITALRSYLRYGLRVGLWIGVSKEHIETIRNIVVNFLKDEFGDEFNCPLKLTPCTGVIAKWLKSMYFMKDARLFSMYTRKLLKWTKLNSSDLGTIEDILQSFVDSLKDAHVKWDEVFPILGDMFHNFKDYVCDLIEKMLKGKTAKPPV